MTPEVIALRAHLVAEVEQRRREVMSWQRLAMEWHTGCATVVARHVTIWQRNAASAHKRARTATDAWLAADARLRALDGLLAASKAQADAVELRRTGTFARGRWHTREEIDALMLAPCEGDTCAWRECLPCGLRRLGAADRPWHEHRSWPPTRAT